MALKEKALRRLAERLNAAGVVWAAGGEWLMCQHGIGESYHQFDIVVSEEDAARADQILSKLGMRTPHPDSADAFRCDYHFDGADIALAAGLSVDGQPLPFSAEDVAGSAAVLGATVPLMALAPWERIYRARGALRQAEAIAAYMNSQSEGQA